MGGAPSPILHFFQALIKTNAPTWGAPHLKSPPPSEKQPPPPLKCEAPFHEMIPRKSTNNNNLKSS